MQTTPAIRLTTTMLRFVEIVALFALSLMITNSVLGDVFFLANGGRIEAELLNPDESPRESYVLRTAFGGRLTLVESQVNRVVVKSDAERSYEARLSSMPETVAAHWDMAQRCQQAKLTEQREFHLRQVLRLQSDHEAARHALGYSRIDGRWMRQDEWMVSQGFERYRGGWRLPQELELQRIEEENDRQVVRWRKQLRTWRGWIAKGRERSRPGEQQIRMVRDPHAAVALADMLADPKEGRALKLLYVDVLGELASEVAIRALTRHSLNDRDNGIRDACLDELSRIGSHKARTAVESYVGALQHEKNYVVHRAAVALAAMNDPTATLPLIDALITEHKQLVGGGGGIQPGFSNRGSSLSVGGSPEIKKVQKQNEPVLHTLNALNPGVNFGYNESAWKNWYIAKRMPPPMSLRRGE